MSTYKIELWDKSLTPIADITKLATDRKFTIGRNAAETLEFTLNLTAFERHCANVLGADPNIILEPLRTNAGLRRNGAYMFGTEIYDCSLGGYPLSARDALHIAIMQRHGVDTIMSFDRGFDRYPGLIRLA